MRAAVLGAGIMGASTSLALAERGHEVTVFEQFALGHKRGSSHGYSRIIRKAYPDAFYTAIMAEAYPLWHELQRFSPEQMVFECGLLYFGPPASDNVLSVLDGLRHLEVAHEVLDHQQVQSVSPSLRLEEGEVGIFTPEAGWVHAERAVHACIERSVSLGATVREGEEADPEALEGQFDGVAVCAGPWVRRHADLQVSTTLQTFGYVEGQVDGPVWIEDCPAFYYGFPSEPGSSTFKVGYHTAGPEIDPSQLGREPIQLHMDGIREQAWRRFGLGDVQATFETCIYTSTPDEDFRWGRVSERSFWVSPCSGHGFKFGPWIGRKMADFLEGKDVPESIPRFCR